MTKSVFITINGHGFFVGFSGDRIDCASAELPDVWRYMPVTFHAPDRFKGEDRFKLMKTRIGAECGARDICDFLIDCCVFDRCTDYALQICQHILAHGRRMR